MNSIQEDIGYMNYKLNKNETFRGINEKIKIEYVSGMMAGKMFVLRRDFADELIKHGKAIEVK